MTYKTTYKGVAVEVILDPCGPDENDLIKTQAIADTIHGRWLHEGWTSVEFSTHDYMVETWANTCRATFISRNPELEWE